MKQLINKNIECEVRGCITLSDFNDIKSEIEDEWGKFEESSELAVFFEGRDMFLKINKNGGVLTIKETVDLKTKAKQETELKFKVDDIHGVVDFLIQSGYKEGLFSYCYRHEVKKQDSSISIKFNTKIGDIFEIDEVVNEGSDYEKIYSKLIKIAIKYGLDTWSRSAYESIVKDSWKDVIAEPLITRGKLHPLIERVIGEAKKIKRTIPKSNVSIYSLLKKKSNDYTALENEFKYKAKSELLSFSPRKIENYKETVSIIIPTFNSKKTLKTTLKSIERQKLHKEQKKQLK